MEKTKALKEIKLWEDKLPYRAKTEIARKMKTNKHSIQNVLNGTASEDLTIKFYKKAKKLYPEQTAIKTRASKKEAA